MKLIDKDTLVAEIDRQKIGYNIDGKHSVEYDTTRKILNIINTLEVKEVDLEKEIKKEYLERRCYGGKNNMFVILNEPQFNEITKHFFELGLRMNNSQQNLKQQQ
jgi:hypothetical protein